MATTTPRKKTAAKKTTAAANGKVTQTSEDIMSKDFDVEAYVPPVLARKKDEDREVLPKLVLFTKENEDGSTEDIHILKKVSFNTSLKASRILNTQSLFAAQEFALTAVLGEENYRWLLDFPDLTEEQWDVINGMAMRTVLGPLEDSGKA